MYEYVGAIIKVDGHWDGQDISAKTLYSLRNWADIEDFRISIKLTDTDNIYEFTQAQFETNFATYDIMMTLNTLIDSLTDLDGLDYYSGRTNLSNVPHAIYYEFWDQGLEIKRHHHSYNFDTEIPEDKQVDLAIWPSIGSKWTASSLYRSCLFMLNGRFVQSMVVGDVLYLIDASKHMTAPLGCLLGFVDFSQLGGIEIVPITEDNTGSRLKTLDSARDVVTYVGITTATDAFQGYGFPVICGTPYFGNSIVVKDGPGQLRLKLYHRSLLNDLMRRKYVERKKYLGNIAGAGITPVSIVEFDAHAAILQGDSFYVKINNTDPLYIKRTKIISEYIEGYYHLYRNMQGIIQFDDKELAHYVAIDDRGDCVTIMTTRKRRVELMEVFDADGNTYISSAIEERQNRPISDATLIDFYTLQDR